MDERLAKRLASDQMYRQMAASNEKLRRNQVWCRSCGHSESVNSARCLRLFGWPKHCGETMTIDHPLEQK